MGMGTDGVKGTALALLATGAMVLAWVGWAHGMTAWATLPAFYVGLALWVLAAIATYGRRMTEGNGS